MSIIYTYPTKSNPTTGDLVLISDVSDDKQTKQVTIGNLVALASGGGGGGGDTYKLQANAKSGTSVPLFLDAASGTDSTVNLKEGSGITLTRNSETEILISTAAVDARSMGFDSFSLPTCNFTFASNKSTFIVQMVAPVDCAPSNFKFFIAAALPGTAGINAVTFAVYKGTLKDPTTATLAYSGFTADGDASAAETFVQGTLTVSSGGTQIVAGQSIVCVFSILDTGGAKPIGIKNSDFLGLTSLALASESSVEAYDTVLTDLLDALSPEAIQTDTRMYFTIFEDKAA